jgi:hypothetical protein
MALSRIWSAFIVIAIGVAVYQWLGKGNEVIFNRMVVGKADDKFTYVPVGAYNGDTSAKAIKSFGETYEPFGFVRDEKLKTFKYIITDDVHSDTVKALKKINPGAFVYTYDYV